MGLRHAVHDVTKTVPGWHSNTVSLSSVGQGSKTNEVGPLSDDWQEWHRTEAHLEFATQETLDELWSSPVFRVSKEERIHFWFEIGTLKYSLALNIGTNVFNVPSKARKGYHILVELQRWAMKYPREKGGQRYSLKQICENERPEITSLCTLVSKTLVMVEKKKCNEVILVLVTKLFRFQECVIWI